MNEKKDEQGDEFRAWVFSFDCGEVEFTTQLIQRKIRKAAAPRRRWTAISQRTGWVVIGAEPLIIGGGYEALPYAALAAEERVTRALVPVPRPDQPASAWSELLHFLRCLRTDPNLIKAVAWMAAGLLWWWWLARGGAVSAGTLGPAVARAALTVPIAFCLLSVLCMAASIVPDLDFVVMRWQARHWTLNGLEG